MRGGDILKDRIKELETQIERQKQGAEITSALMKNMEEENERLKKEIRILKGGLAISNNWAPNAE